MNNDVRIKILKNLKIAVTDRAKMFMSILILASLFIDEI
jgi:hypothetical protein